ncbi:NUDIX domain-containing protein [bacterium]|nr:NUDIX domain-containing protein [bacterium]
MTPNRFNLRIYGIITNSNGDVLISDERRNGVSFTKFPGGGLEFGEGLADGLKRELNEELGIDAEIGEPFYVNDFFQESAFRSSDQLISFYYRVSKYSKEIPITNHTFPLSEDGEKFRWVSITDLNVEMMTFPIDKIVVERLISGGI